MGSEYARVTRSRQGVAGCTQTRSKYIGEPRSSGPIGGLVGGDPGCPEAFFTRLPCLVSDFEVLAQVRSGSYRTGFGEMQEEES